MTRVIHVNTSDRRGGAARAVCRLHLGLRKLGLDSLMFVQNKEGEDRLTHGAETKAGKLLAKIRPYIDRTPVTPYKGEWRQNFSPAVVPGLAARRIRQIGADVVNLHWITKGFIRVEALRHFGARPIVWTLHDSWAFTGGCHVPFECTRYMAQCGHCPILGSRSDRDLSRTVWLRKAKVLRNLDVTIVTPSNWLGECAKRSSLCQGLRVETIPNGLDIEKYKPLDQSFCREALSLPKHKKMILFGAMYATDDKNKGFRYLASALKQIAQTAHKDELTAVVLGNAASNGELDLGIDVRFLGHFHDDISMSVAYSAADVFVAPSMQENLSNMVMEAMACGVPCVAFNIGGMPDMIEHERTGYLVEPYEVEDLAKGLLWVLGDDGTRGQLSMRSRHKVEEEFSDLRSADRYASLYKELGYAESVLPKRDHGTEA